MHLCTWLIELPCCILSIFIQCILSTYLKKKKVGYSWKFLDCHNIQTCTTSPMIPSSAAGFCLYTTCPYIFIFYHLCFSVPSLCLDELNNIMNCYYPWYSVWYNNLLHRPMAWKPEVVICSQAYGRLQCQIQGCIQCSYWRISEECISQEVSQLVHNRCLYIIHHLISSYYYHIQIR